jgi:hypothetical protein
VVHACKQGHVVLPCCRTFTPSLPSNSHPRSACPTTISLRHLAASVCAVGRRSGPRRRASATSLIYITQKVRLPEHARDDIAAHSCASRVCGSVCATLLLLVVVPSTRLSPHRSLSLPGRTPSSLWPNQRVQAG